MVTCMYSGQAAPRKPAHTQIAQACAIFVLPPTLATRQNLVPPLPVIVSSVRPQRHRVEIGCCDHDRAPYQTLVDTQDRMSAGLLRTVHHSYPGSVLP